MSSNDVAIADHAAIGDCRSVALVTRDGVVDWLCWPTFSSPALFAGLLDPDGGVFRVGPRHDARVERRYLPDTNVLETLFTTDDGRCRLVDFMPVQSTEGGLGPARELVRIVEGIEGRSAMTISYAPRPRFACRPGRLRHHGSLGWALADGGEVTWLHSEVPLAPAANGRDLKGEFHLAAGERRILWLTHAAGEIGVVPALAEAPHRLKQTISYWRDWVGRCTYRGDHQDVARRSLLALKLLIYAPSGAVIAAPTTSLPEAVGVNRNWDYRYCWLRDSSLTFRALNDSGFHAEAARYLRWLVLATRLSAPRLRVVYDVYGRPNLSEKRLGHLAGWRGSRPVRVGNDARRQFQLDLYGEAMATVADFADHGGELTDQEANLVEGWGDTVTERWQWPDSGIWEVRTKPRHFTYSKAMAWSSCDALARMIETGRVPGRDHSCAELRATQRQIADAIERQGVDRESGSYVAAFGERDVDASLLLLPWFGYADARSPGMRATLRRVLAELGGDDGLVKRYRTGFDGFDSEEGAFVACGFWAADCLARSGELDEAERRIRNLAGMANDVGLLAEEIDPATGAQLGNFPQAFSHIAVVNAAMTLADERRKVAHG